MTPANLTPADLRPHQIFYLEQGNSRLYGELIQFVAERNLCWLRPIALYCQAEDADPLDRNRQSCGREATLYDLGQGSDLICPDSLLRMALDAELLPLLAQLHDPKPGLASAQNGHQLRQFIQRLWQAEPEAFQR